MNPGFFRLDTRPDAISRYGLNCARESQQDRADAGKGVCLMRENYASSTEEPRKAGRGNNRFALYNV